MYTRLEESDQRRVDSIYNTLSLDDRIAQTFNVNLSQCSPADAQRLYERCRFGAGFFAYRSANETRAVMDAIGSGSVPPLGCADLVNGAGSRLAGATLFPWQMAVGAADSEDLARKMGLATAVEGREAGLHWTFGPIVDLSISKDNSMMHTRTFGVDPGHVLRMSQAFIRGVQAERRMAATAKHFPGDGVDDRDSHVCTSVNPLSRDEWFDLYGRVWKPVVQDAYCVMSGHIGLPWIDPAKDYLGPAPATLSSAIQIDLLRNQLGFEGLVVSDAIPMIGFSAFAPYRNRIAGNIESGSDMILWPDPKRDVQEMKQALDEGLLTEARLESAVKNVLALKLWLGVLDRADVVPAEHGPQTFARWADEIGERSVCVVRNERRMLPVRLERGAKVATVTLSMGSDTRGYVKELTVVDEELRARGYEVEHLENPDRNLLATCAAGSDAVFINVHVMPVYGTTRFAGPAVAALWNSFWHEHPAVVFTSFGDPYKLYEMPYAPNFVMTFSNTPSSQRAAVKVWLGEIEPQGKVPVRLPGFFNIAVASSPAIEKE
jgi:beta-N-acetylhexosaminidase